jgi:hypothetical protein
MGNILDEICGVSQKAHFGFSNIFLPNLSSLWDDVETYDGAREAKDDNKIKRIGFLNTRQLTLQNTHSEYVILIAFPLQTRLNVTFTLILPALLRRPTYGTLH